MPLTQAQADYCNLLESTRDAYGSDFRSIVETMLRRMITLDKLQTENQEDHDAVYDVGVGTDALIDAERVVVSGVVDTLFATGRINTTRQELEDQINPPLE